MHGPLNRLRPDPSKRCLYLGIYFGFSRGGVRWQTVVAVCPRLATSSPDYRLEQLTVVEIEPKCRPNGPSPDKSGS